MNHGISSSPVPALLATGCCDRRILQNMGGIYLPPRMSPLRETANVASSAPSKKLRCRFCVACDLGEKSVARVNAAAADMLLIWTVSENPYPRGMKEICGDECGPICSCVQISAGA